MFGIQLKKSALKQTKWYEYLIRFVFGGLVTVVAGLIAKKFGPVVGGLFLAFPSIFPASVTLVQTHKKKEEQKKGEGEEEGKAQGIHDAGLTAEGTALGSFGLLAFGLVIWQLSPNLSPVIVLLLALFFWFVVAFLVWLIVEKGVKKNQE